MHTDQPYTPDGACRGACNHRNRQTWTDYQHALDDHANALTKWASGDQKGEPPTEPEPPQLRWYPGNPLFCGRDIATTRRSLLELDVQAAQLDATSDGHRAPAPTDRGRVSGTKTSASVSPAADVLDTMLGELMDAEDEWRDLRGYTPRPPAARGPRGAHPRSRTITWLADHLDGMLAHEGMAYLPRRIYQWERILRHLNKDERPANSSPIRCPRPACGERRVTWDDEHHYYACGACGQVIYEHEHDQHQREQADALKAAELAAAPPPPAVRHQVLVPAAGDDHETRAAGTLPVTNPIRIDPDTLRLTFHAPYRRPLTEEEFPTLPWPPCPACGGRIDVDYAPITEIAQREPTAYPCRWRCAGDNDRDSCGASGRSS